MPICSGCGRYFAPEEAGSSEDIRSRSELVGAVVWNRTERADFCPECAKSRRGMLGIAFKALCFILVGLLVIVLLGFLQQSERKADPSQAESVKWVLADREAAQVGNVEVSLTAKIDALKDLVPGIEQAPKQKCLLLELLIKNTSATEVVEYQTWRIAGGVDQPSVQLTDNLGKTYQKVSLGLLVDLPNRTEEATIQPRKSISDVLVYELPDEKAESLRLILPASAIKARKGMFRFSIPQTSIKR